MTGPGFPNLFSALEIGNVTLKNRIVSTGHETAMADENGISEAMIAYHEARAKGGAGLIVVEVALVDDAAVFVAHPIKVTGDDCIPRYRRLAQVVHRHDCRLFGQLFHPGREIIDSLDGSAPVSYAPSAVPNERFHVMPVPMSSDHIAAVVTGFGDGARRLREAGLDGAELLASHGYLLAQFLNPRVNRRDDDYGGDFDGRLRLIREIIADIRAKAGADFALGLRISGDERSHDGLSGAEVVEICSALAADGGLDYYSVVAGSSTTLAGSIHIVPPMTVETGYTAPYAAKIRAVVGKPVIATGRINQPQIAEGIIAAGQADACGMTRAMICDPEMADKARAGRVEDIRACIACNQACIGHFLSGYPISCIQHPETGREREFGARKPAATAKRVMVVGGGPAGMKAAAVAAERGHQVTLYEAEAQLGGQARLAQLLPQRLEFGGIITNLTREMALAGVEVRADTRVDAALIEREAPEAVVLATGAKPRRPKIEGAEEAQVVDAWQVLRGEANVGASVVVADWRADWIGIGIAEKLAEEGCRVRLCVNGYMPGQTIQQYVRDTAIGRLHKLGVEWISYLRLFGADADSVYLQHTMSGEPVVCEGVDTLVLCLGHERVAELETALGDLGIETHLAGDCLAPRTAEEAVLEGLKAGCAL
jgi:2,4-dienoyl-CoA reductase-like NADH-dependent reductase (Old Yellow Enzyme family)